MAARKRNWNIGLRVIALAVVAIVVVGRGGQAGRRSPSLTFAAPGTAGPGAEASHDARRATIQTIGAYDGASIRRT